MLGFKHLLIVMFEALDPRIRLGMGQSQPDQGLPAHFQAGIEGLAHRQGVHVHQPMHMLAVACAGDDFHLRVELAHQLGGLDVGVRVVGGNHEKLRFADFRGLEDFRAHRVAVEHGHAAEAAGQFDGFHRRVEGDELDVLRPQDTRDDLPHPAHAGDHHTGSFGVEVAEFLRHLHRLHLGAEQTVAHQQQQRRQRHGQGDGQHQQVVQMRFEQPLIATDLEHHKGKLTAGRQDDAEANGVDLAQASGQSTDDKQQWQLAGDEQQGQAQHQGGRTQQQAQVRAHADTDEKQPQQQALERFYLRFQFMAVLGVRQQQAGKEGAKGHRHTDQIHQPCRTDDHQQRRGRGHLGQAGFGHHPEHRTQQVASADHDDGYAAQHPQAVIHIVGSTGVVIDAGQQRHHGDQRDRGDVLEQQNGKRQASVGAGQFLAFGQALQAKRR